MTIYDSLIAKAVMGSGGGGGGGSSDFSTATVSFVSESAEASLALAIPIVITEDDEASGADITAFVGDTLTVILYKGKCYGTAYPSGYVISSVSGDIEVDGDYLTITGDGTITLAYDV